MGNIRSAHLLSRLGFVLEGTLRATHFFDGRWHDHHLYALLQPDWGEVRHVKGGDPLGT